MCNFVDYCDDDRVFNIETFKLQFEMCNAKDSQAISNEFLILILFDE